MHFRPHDDRRWVGVANEVALVEADGQVLVTIERGNEAWLVDRVGPTVWRFALPGR